MTRTRIETRLRASLGPVRRQVVSKASDVALKFAGARIYFTLSGDFAGEQKAVASGRGAHSNAVGSNSGSMFLRRSIHRIEKGLSQPEVRNSFATDYILPATRTAIAAGLNPFDGGEAKWARDVLDEYFSTTATSQHASIVRARELWFSRDERPEVEPSGALLKPFPYHPLSDSDSFNTVRDVAAHRRSVRWFEDRKVSRDAVMDAVEVGLMGPSACNRQSFRFILVEDEELRGQVAAVPMGTAGFADQIPLLGVIVGQHRGYEHQRDRHAIFVDGGLFATGFILALEAMGLSSCCINWPELEEKNVTMKKLLGLSDDERVVMLVAIGHSRAGQLVPRSHKRAANIVAVWK